MRAGRAGPSAGESQPTIGVETAAAGRTPAVRLPMTFRRRGGRKLILAPDGADGLSAEPPRPDGTALRALGRAWHWHRLLEAGRYGSIKALARAEGLLSLVEDLRGGGDEERRDAA